MPTLMSFQATGTNCPRALMSRAVASVLLTCDKGWELVHTTRPHVQVFDTRSQEGRDCSPEIGGTLYMQQ